MECPNCHYVRQDKDLVVPAWQCPHCGVAYVKFQAPIEPRTIVRAHLTSGHEIQFSRVRLYDLLLVKQLDALRQVVSKKFAGFSTGLGFWGSMQWVVVGSLITGAIENSVSNKMAQEGQTLLADLGALTKHLRDTAVLVHVSAIENIQYPDIGLWKAVIGDRMMKRDLIHIASEYVIVEVDGKETALFWDKIERYEVTEKD